MTSATITGDLSLGHILAATGLDFSDVVILRHTYTVDGLESASDLTPEKVLDYTRRRGINNKLGKTPPRFWLIFMADGGRRSRFLTACPRTRTTARCPPSAPRPCATSTSAPPRCCPPSSAGSSSSGRETPSTGPRTPPPLRSSRWPRSPTPRWCPSRALTGCSSPTGSCRPWWRTRATRPGALHLAPCRASTSSPTPAPGSSTSGRRTAASAFSDAGSPTHATATAAISHCGTWQASTPPHARHFQFSILRVFGPSVPTAEVDEAESHFKRALLTRQHGLNQN